MSKLREKLKEFAEKGFFHKILAGLAAFCIVSLGTAAAVVFSLLVASHVTDSFGYNLLTTVFLIIFIPWTSFAPYLLYLYGLPKAENKSKKTGRHSYTYGRTYHTTVEEFSRVPHFDVEFGKDKTDQLLEKENFGLCLFRDGSSSSNLLVSESGKWFSIAGEYFPTDFICGYNSGRNELYTIDGVIIKLPLAAGSRTATKELTQFFQDRGSYYKKMPLGARVEFNHSVHSGYDAIYKADWGQLRYVWEKSLLENSNRYSDHIAVRHYEAVLDDGAVNTDIFTRVLSRKEIIITVSAIRDRKADLKTYMDFSSYRNEYSVCNGIEILTIVGHPLNEEGVDFLFDCLTDLDELYFSMAVDAIKLLPRKLRQEKMEERAKAAYEAGSVEKLAGLLYLSKELDYEIKYISKIRASGEQEAASQNAVDITQSAQARAFVYQDSFDKAGGLAQAIKFEG